jgi:hypothetical protein
MLPINTIVSIGITVVPVMVIMLVVDSAAMVVFPDDAT